MAPRGDKGRDNDNIRAPYQIGKIQRKSRSATRGSIVRILRRGETTSTRTAVDQSALTNRSSLSHCDLSGCNNVLERCQTIRLHLLARRKQRESQSPNKCQEPESGTKVCDRAEKRDSNASTDTLDPSGRDTSVSTQALIDRFEGFQRRADMCVGRLEGYKREADTLSRRLEKFNLKVTRLLNEDVQSLNATT